LTHFKWNTPIIGHQVTGYIAQEFLTQSSQKLIQDILPPEYEGSLSKAAIWADGNYESFYVLL